MIYQNDKNENTQNQFSNALKELQIGKLLRNSNITKSCGVSAYEVFQFLLLLVFQGRNLFRFLNSKHKDQAISKNTYYRFLNETSYNWSRFLLLLAAKVTSRFDALTRPERVKVLVLDDSVVKRNRSKSVELLARVYDHVEHRFQKGFTLLTLGWSDGYSFIPVSYTHLLKRIAEYFNVTTDYLLGLSDMKRDLSGQIKMNETLDEYYDLIEVYRRMDGYDREMVWSIMQTVGKTAEKRKQGVGNDKSSDL